MKNHSKLAREIYEGLVSAEIVSYPNHVSAIYQVSRGDNNPDSIETALKNMGSLEVEYDRASGLIELSAHTQENLHASLESIRERLFDLKKETDKSFAGKIQNEKIRQLAHDTVSTFYDKLIPYLRANPEFQQPDKTITYSKEILSQGLGESSATEVAEKIRRSAGQDSILNVRAYQSPNDSNVSIIEMSLQEGNYSTKMECLEKLLESLSPPGKGMRLN